MSELPAAPQDPHKRYRSYLGARCTLVDRRIFWASIDRELVGYGGLRRGEVRARRAFWRLIQRGVDPSQALTIAIGLDAGPIPELHTVEQFDSIWTAAHVRGIADRWASSALTQRCAAPPVTTAISMLEDAAPELAAVLITQARDPRTKDSVRRQAARDGLVMAGARVLPGQPTVDPDPIVLTGEETVEQLERLLLTIPQRVKDPNRARLITENIQAHLAARAPETWGKKLKLTHEGQVGLAGILVDMDRRREEALAEARRDAVDAETTPLLPEAVEG